MYEDIPKRIVYSLINARALNDNCYPNNCSRYISMHKYNCYMRINFTVFIWIKNILRFLADFKLEKKELLNRTRTVMCRHSTPTEDGQWPDIESPLINTNYFAPSASALQYNTHVHAFVYDVYHLCATRCAIGFARNIIYCLIWWIIFFFVFLRDVFYCSAKILWYSGADRIGRRRGTMTVWRHRHFEPKQPYGEWNKIQYLA
jgi:hypothetical protein